jgi:S-formylglutathione hydrolase
MTFSIFLPNNTQPPNVLYFLAGLTGDHEQLALKSGFAPAAKANNLAVVFPDTSPRGLDGYKDLKMFNVGYGAGFYCDASHKDWKHF